MNKVKPITPEEASDGSHIPDEVFEVFNNLIREKFTNSQFIIKQNAVLDALPPEIKAVAFAKGYLNIEKAYEKAGWRVVYDKPSWNDGYEPYFSFNPLSL